MSGSWRHALPAGLAVAGLGGSSDPAHAQGGPHTIAFDRGGERFVLVVSPDREVALVVAQRGGVATIKLGAGNLDVGLPDGWGGCRATMDEAVEYAFELCLEVRTHLKSDQVVREMAACVESARRRAAVQAPPLFRLAAAGGPCD